MNCVDCVVFPAPDDKWKRSADDLRKPDYHPIFDIFTRPSQPAYLFIIPGCPSHTLNVMNQIESNGSSLRFRFESTLCAPRRKCFMEWFIIRGSICLLALGHKTWPLICCYHYVFLAAGRKRSEANTSNRLLTTRLTRTNVVRIEKLLFLRPKSSPISPFSRWGEERQWQLGYN